MQYTVVQEMYICTYDVQLYTNIYNYANNVQPHTVIYIYVMHTICYPIFVLL